MILDPPLLQNPLNQNEESNLVLLYLIITRKWLRFTQGSEMISPNSFCRFVFAKAYRYDLDPPFLYNLLNKNEETNLIYFSETVEFA